MKVEVVRNRNSAFVVLKQGHQSFQLWYEGTVEECRWYARMFRLALKNHDEEAYRKRFVFGEVVRRKKR